MHKQFANAFYGSNAWKLCREAYKKQAGGLCEICLQRGLIEPGTEVHHKIELTPGNITQPEITLNFENLMLLCSECHKQQKPKYKGRRWQVDAAGNVTIR